MTELPANFLSSFDTFIATPAAIQALDLSRALAARLPDGPRLLLLHGPPGSGKTHLLHAIIHAVQERDPSAAVLRTSALECVQDLIAALRPDEAGDLPRPWPPRGVVTIDDLHILSGKPATQREVGRVFGAALDRGSRLACAVGRLDEIPQIIEAVRGLPGARLAELPRPSHRDMRRILDSMARAEGWLLSPETLDSMASACRGDVRRAASAMARQRFERGDRGSHSRLGQLVDR